MHSTRSSRQDSINAHTPATDAYEDINYYFHKTLAIVTANHSHRPTTQTGITVCNTTGITLMTPIQHVSPTMAILVLSSDHAIPATTDNSDVSNI